MANKLNVNKLMKTLSEILSEKHGCKVTITATPKDLTHKIERRNVNAPNPS